MWSTDGRLSPDMENLVLTIRDHIVEMGGKEENFERDVDIYLTALRDHILKNHSL